MSAIQNAYLYNIIPYHPHQSSLSCIAITSSQYTISLVNNGLSNTKWLVHCALVHCFWCILHRKHVLMWTNPPAFHHGTLNKQKRLGMRMKEFFGYIVASGQEAEWSGQVLVHEEESQNYAMHLSAHQCMEGGSAPSKFLNFWYIDCAILTSHCKYCYITLIFTCMSNTL